MFEASLRMELWFMAAVWADLSSRQECLPNSSPTMSQTQTANRLKDDDVARPYAAQIDCRCDAFSLRR